MNPLKLCDWLSVGQAESEYLLGVRNLADVNLSLCALVFAGAAGDGQDERLRLASNQALSGDLSTPG